MKLTNKHNLPQAFVDAVAARPYIRKSTLSVTEMADPLQKTILTHRYFDQLEEDAIDRVWALLGSAAHEILARSTEGAQLVEERLHATFATSNGYITVSGQPDRIDADHRLRDFKITSAWTMVYRSRDIEWARQLSYYRVLATIATDLEIQDEAEIIAIIRDFNQHQAGQGSYPEFPVCVVPISLLSLEDAYKQMFDYCSQYLLHKGSSDEALPPCSPEDRWTQPDRFAIYKNNTVKRASRVFDSEAEALALLTDLQAEVDGKGKAKNPTAYVEQRKGGPRRCEDYCPVSRFCHQHQSELRMQPAVENPFNNDE